MTEQDYFQYFTEARAYLRLFLAVQSQLASLGSILNEPFLAATPSKYRISANFTVIWRQFGLLYSTLGSTHLINPVDTPTFVGVASTAEGLVEPFLKLFRLFKWVHITLLKEETAITELYDDMYNAMKSVSFAANHPGLYIEGFSFNADDQSAMSRGLAFANGRSRGNMGMKFLEVSIRDASYEIITYPSGTDY